MRLVPDKDYNACFPRTRGPKWAYFMFGVRAVEQGVAPNIAIRRNTQVKRLVRTANSTLESAVTLFLVGLGFELPGWGRVATLRFFRAFQFAVCSSRPKYFGEALYARRRSALRGWRGREANTWRGCLPCVSRPSGILWFRSN